MSRLHESGGKAVAKFPKRFWSRVSLVIDKPIPAKDVSAALLQEKVSKLLDGNT